MILEVDNLERYSVASSTSECASAGHAGEIESGGIPLNSLCCGGTSSGGADGR